MSLDDSLNINLKKVRDGGIDRFTFEIGDRVVPAAFVSINGNNTTKDPDALPILLGVLFAKINQLRSEYPGVSIRYGDRLLDPNDLSGINFDYTHEGEFGSLAKVDEYLSSAGITDNNPLIDGVRLERRQYTN